MTRGRAGERRGTTVLMGRNPVVEALRMHIPVTALYAQTRADADGRWREALRLAAAAGLPILEVSRAELDRMTDGGVHQGLVLTMPEFPYADVDELAAGTLLVALDGVTDPRNLGAVARSVAAFGGDGVIIPTRRAVGVTASAWKSSAGALARLPVARVTNMTRALDGLKRGGFTVVGLAADAPSRLTALPADVLKDKLVIVVGAEGAGLSRLVSETCDWLAGIEMTGGTESLNASVAASIALHAAFTAR